MQLLNNKMFDKMFENFVGLKGVIGLLWNGAQVIVVAEWPL